MHVVKWIFSSRKKTLKILVWLLNSARVVYILIWRIQSWVFSLQADTKSTVYGGEAWKKLT